MEDGENFKYDPDKNYDEATMEQQQQLDRQISDSQELISCKLDLSTLQEEFKEDQVFLAKIEDLKQRFKYLRRTRADGNCFFRAFGYAYLESLLTNKDEYKRFLEVVRKSKDNLLALGFPDFTTTDFYDTFLEAVETVGKDGFTVMDLLKMFNDQAHSDYLIAYLRLLVSGHLQKEEEFYANFVEGGRSVKEFCHQEVEPMGKESDHMHITALTTVTGVPVQIEYMDRGEGEVNDIHFPEGSDPLIILLYKPGHYDILYTS